MCVCVCWPHQAACGILVPWPGIEPGPGSESTNPNHWTTREFPQPLYCYKEQRLTAGISDFSIKWPIRVDLPKKRNVCTLSHVRLCVTPWTVAHQAPLSMGFSRQEYCSGLPFPSPGDLPDPGIKLTSPVSPALVGRFFTTWEAQKRNGFHQRYIQDLTSCMIENSWECWNALSPSQKRFQRPTIKSNFPPERSEGSKHLSSTQPRTGIFTRRWEQLKSHFTGQWDKLPYPHTHSPLQHQLRDFLVVHWLRLHTPNAGAQVWSLVREQDPTCLN